MMTSTELINCKKENLARYAVKNYAVRKLVVYSIVYTPPPFFLTKRKNH